MTLQIGSRGERTIAPRLVRSAGAVDANNSSELVRHRWAVGDISTTILFNLAQERRTVRLHAQAY
jgi:hypothetical protein